MVREMLFELAIAILLVGSRRALVLVAASAHQVVAASLDRRFPDDLLLTAGEWLQGQLTHRKLDDVGVIIAPSGGQPDAWVPGARLVSLSPGTWFKRDPSFWAVAAHELGHVIVHRAHPVLAPLFAASRGLSLALAWLAQWLLVADLALADPLVLDVALVALVGSLVASVGVLFDEALASVTAVRVLDEDARLTPRQLSGARIVLASAFGTYIAGAIGTVVLAVAFNLLRSTVLGSPLAIAPGPATTPWVMGPLTGLLLGHAWLVLRRATRRPSRMWDALSRLQGAAEQREKVLQRELLRRRITDLMGFAGAAVLTWFLIDEPGSDSLFALGVALAALPMAGPVLRGVEWLLNLVLLPLTLPLVAVIVFVLGTAGQGEKSPRFEADVARGEQRMEQSAERWELARQRMRMDPPWWSRVSELASVAYLPLLILYWTG